MVKKKKEKRKKRKTKKKKEKQKNKKKKQKIYLTTHPESYSNAQKDQKWTEKEQ